MSYDQANRSGATGTRTRLGDDVNPQSGMCVVCQEDCPGYCEVAQSALRGPELLYPQPYGHMTAASQKQYPVDYSHLSIMGTAVGAHGIAEDSDQATFPNVDLTASIGHDGGIKLNLPIVVPGLGSTDVARRHWEGLAIGAAISGIMLTIGENVVGMDETSKIEGGRVVDAPELRRRVDLYKKYANGSGAIVVQENVEDSRLGVLEYAVRELGVSAVELKWGQGAKDIGGEVKIESAEKAQDAQGPWLPGAARSRRASGRRLRQSVHGVRAAQPGRHGHPGRLPRAGGPAPRRRRQVRVPEDGRLPADRPRTRGQVRVRSQARPADHRRCRAAAPA